MKRLVETAVNQLFITVPISTPGDSVEVDLSRAAMDNIE